MKQSNIRGIAVILAILLFAVGFAYAEGSAPTFRDVGFKVFGRYFDFNGTQATNMSNISFNASYNYSASAHYIDILDNDTAGDLIFRSKNATGTLTERFRIKAKVAAGGAVVFTEINLPTVRPSNSLNGSIVLNTTVNLTEVYSNGTWQTPCRSLTSRPTTPINCDTVLNLTDNLLEVYANGAWHYAGNGTVKS